mmetsp:Transcript_24888/g.62485  ORF Transcript_24888/g.62485 Transcript_24888/m.62485 type:complete len:207 (+) Transcript_24888:1282-1902(+)
MLCDFPGGSLDHLRRPFRDRPHSQQQNVDRSHSRRRRVRHSLREEHRSEGREKHHVHHTHPVQLRRLLQPHAGALNRECGHLGVHRTRCRGVPHHQVKERRSETWLPLRQSVQLQVGRHRAHHPVDSPHGHPVDSHQHHLAAVDKLREQWVHRPGDSSRRLMEDDLGGSSYHPEVDSHLVHLPADSSRRLVVDNHRVHRVHRLVDS